MEIGVGPALFLAGEDPEHPAGDAELQLFASRPIRLGYALRRWGGWERLQKAFGVERDQFTGDLANGLARLGFRVGPVAAAEPAQAAE